MSNFRSDFLWLINIINWLAGAGKFEPKINSSHLFFFCIIFCLEQLVWLQFACQY